MNSLLLPVRSQIVHGSISATYFEHSLFCSLSLMLGLKPESLWPVMQSMVKVVSF